MQLNEHTFAVAGKRFTPNEIPKRRLFIGPKITDSNNIALKISTLSSIF
jgi:hypothetical protein